MRNTRPGVEQLEGRLAPAAAVAPVGYYPLGSPHGQLLLYGQAGDPAPAATLTPFPGYTGPVTAGRADVNGDGVWDLVAVGDDPGHGAHAKVFDGATLAELFSDFAFEGYHGGVAVFGGGDATDHVAGHADFATQDLAIMATGAGVGYHVKVWQGPSLSLAQSFLAFPGAVAPLGGYQAAYGEAEVWLGVAGGPYQHRGFVGGALAEDDVTPSIG